MTLYHIRQFLSFYWSATTKYRIHSPFVFEWIAEVLENDRWYYAFDDIERVRRKMAASDAVIEVNDYGAGPSGRADQAAGPQKRDVPLSRLASGPSSSPAQGRRWFHIARWSGAKQILELGAAVGVGTMYIASGRRAGRVLALEGCPNTAGVARVNLEVLKLHNARVEAGPFDNTLNDALKRLGKVDLVFFDGDHRREATLRYFEACLPYIHESSVFVLDDIYWSEGMTAAWEQIKSHPRVRLTLDCFDFGVVFFNPDFHQQQHFRLVPAKWKPWIF